MKETRTETIRKVSKREHENPYEDKNTLQIESDVTVTRITSLSELRAAKHSLEQDLEDSKERVVQIESKLKDMDSLIAMVNADTPQ